MHPLRSLCSLVLVSSVLSAGLAAQQETIQEARFRLNSPKAGSPGSAVLELVSKDAKASAIHRQIDGTQGVTFRDDGLGHDLVAGDGVFAGLVPADLNHEAQIFQGLVVAMGRGTAVPVFEGRELVDKVDSRKLLPTPKPGTLPILPTSPLTTVIPSKSLFITNTAVLDNLEYSYNVCDDVGNELGPWTFGHLMTELAGPNDPSQFALDWIHTWAEDQVVGGFTSAARMGMVGDLLSLWPTDDEGNLDMVRAPFKPIAIVLRVDLRKSNGYGQGSAGEARIVFNLIDGGCIGRKTTVIFEYAINKSGCAIKQWGEDWAALSDLPQDSDEYRAALADLTTQFTDVTTNPQGNGLAQLRTNEFTEEPWELREFKLSGGALVNDTVKLSPQEAFNGTPILAQVMNGDSALLSNLIGGHSWTFPVGFWTGAGVLDNDDRHELALNTCNGCHGRETNNLVGFRHLSQASYGFEATLSGFLDGVVVDDPVDGTERVFADLERRRQDLQNLIDTSCFSGLMFQAVALSH